MRAGIWGTDETLDYCGYALTGAFGRAGLDLFGAVELAPFVERLKRQSATDRRSCGVVVVPGNVPLDPEPSAFLNPALVDRYVLTDRMGGELRGLFIVDLSRLTFESVLVGPENTAIQYGFGGFDGPEDLAASVLDAVYALVALGIDDPAEPSVRSAFVGPLEAELGRLQSSVEELITLWPEVAAAAQIDPELRRTAEVLTRLLEELIRLQDPPTPVLRATRDWFGDRATEFGSAAAKSSGVAVGPALLFEFTNILESIRRIVG